MLLIRSLHSSIVLHSNSYYTVVASIFLARAASCKTICVQSEFQTILSHFDMLTCGKYAQVLMHGKGSQYFRSPVWVEGAVLVIARKTKYTSCTFLEKQTCVLKCTSAQGVFGSFSCGALQFSGGVQLLHFYLVCVYVCVSVSKIITVKVIYLKI